ncbi:MAG: hypothetical protein WCW02_01590 [Candidatus Buchananbacteria bacterium]
MNNKEKAKVVLLAGFWGQLIYLITMYLISWKVPLTMLYPFQYSFFSCQINRWSDQYLFALSIMLIFGQYLWIIPKVLNEDEKKESGAVCAGIIFGLILLFVLCVVLLAGYPTPLITVIKVGEYILVLLAIIMTAACKPWEETEKPKKVFAEICLFSSIMTIFGGPFLGFANTLLLSAIMMLTAFFATLAVWVIKSGYELHREG